MGLDSEGVSISLITSIDRPGSQFSFTLKGMMAKPSRQHDPDRGSPPEWMILCMDLSRRWQYLQVEGCISECREWHLMKQGETWTDELVDGIWDGLE
jgi:hypothetical protein